MGDPSSKEGAEGSGYDPSVTSVAGPSVVRERTPDIERGMVLAGRYQVEAVIGRGGSGIVLRAFDRTAQTVVAVKVLKPELVHDERWARRFSRELRLGRPIRHPNVCRIFDIGEGDGHRFLTMELATGGTLRDLIKRGEPLRPFEERLKDAAAAIGGLGAIHQAGIVHRDVKPDNMLRMEDGRLALSDFGLATDLPTAAAVTVMVGTPHYMAPEVRAGEPATARSDVWSLGVVLYEIFFGKRPERRSFASAEGMSKPPAPLTSTPTERAMLALCEACLADSPTDRPPDAQAVARLFDAAQASPRRFVWNKKPRALAIGLAMLAAGAVLGVRALRQTRAGSPRPPSRGAAVAKLELQGDAANWRDSVRRVATIPGHVDCFSMVGSAAARLIWGDPRRAEDVDVESGVRRQSPLLPETFTFGCPQVSPRGDALLFTAHTATGVNEVRMSKRLDGGESSSVVVGSDPLWMASGEEFLYQVDGVHPARFSLPTMAVSLLPDPGLGSGQMIADMTVDRGSNRVGVLFVDAQTNFALALYRDQAVEVFSIPAARTARFDGTDHVLLPNSAPASRSVLMKLDPNSATLTSVGRVPELQIVDVAVDPRASLVLARRRSKDAWLYDSGQWRRLTVDGKNYSAAVSRSGEVLLSKIGDDGAAVIWSQRVDGSLKRLTSGPRDVSPEFSPDGQRWVYIDYARKHIMLCRTSDAVCSVLHAEDNLLGWPRFSPNGEMLAYVTQSSASRLKVITLSSGLVKDVSPTHWECPPTWSSDMTVWDLEGSAAKYIWTERSISGGERTGREEDFVGQPRQEDCWSSRQPATSRFFQRVRIETFEEAQLLALKEELR
jgi:serine/threonine-protein kinase